MSLKERAPGWVAFVFLALIWIFLFFTIAYFGMKNELVTLPWPYLVVFSIGLVVIGVMCRALPAGDIFADRIAAKTVLKRVPKKNIELRWTPQARADSVIDTQIHLFNANRHSHSERDPHAWLALTLESRKNWGGREKSFYYQLTSRYSVLNLNHAPVALALFILHREDPQAAATYAKKLEQMMLPVYELIERGEFISKWRATNPWTVANHAEVAEAVAESFKNPYA